MRGLNNSYDLLSNIVDELITNSKVMKFTHVLLISMIGINLAEPLSAQVQRTMSFDAGTSFLLRELSAMIVQNENGLQVEMIMGGGNPTDQSITDDLKRGDVLLMMNGKRVSEIATMRELYNSLPDGEEIKVGVRRGDARFIVRAHKGDIPENAPGQMVLSFDAGDGAAPTMIPELGLLISQTDQGIEIMSLLEPLLPEELTTENIEGYLITSINKKSFDEPINIQQYLASLKVGDAIDLELEKDGLTKNLALKKQEPRGDVRMSIDN